MKIQMQVKSCNDCNHLDIKKVFAVDSFEQVHRLVCLKTLNVVSHNVETFDNIKIPNWCPCKDYI